MSTIEKLLATVLAGHPDACAPLADALQEASDPRGVRLKVRFRRWQNAVRKILEDAAESQRLLLVEWAEITDRFRRAGGITNISIEIVPDTSHENRLLLAYVRRLMAKP